MIGNHLQWVLIMCFLIVSCKSLPENPTATLPINEIPTDSQVAEPPPLTFKATVAQPTFCHNGPNESYLRAIPLPANTDVEVLGMNSDGGDWFMIRGKEIDICWIEAKKLNLPINIDFGKVLILTTIITKDNASCRIYPDVEYSVQTIIPANRRVVAYGKSDMDASWVWIIPHDSTKMCWVEKNALTDFINTSLPIESGDLGFILTMTNQPNIPANTKLPHDNTNNPTSVLPTSVPPTSVPPTSVPPTSVPPTSVPPQSTATLCWPPGHCK